MARAEADMRHRCLLLGLVLGLGLALLAAGQTPAPAPDAAAGPWSGEFNLSYVQTTGNTENQTLGAGLKAAWQSAPWKVSLAAAFLRAESEHVETARKSTAALRGEYDFTPRFGVYAQESYLRDLFAGISQQWITGAGAVYKVVLGPPHAVAFSAGVAYTVENREPPDADRDFWGGTVGLSYKWKISASTEFTEDAIYLANFKDSKDWRFNNAAALSVSMTKVLAVKLSHLLQYMHLPGTGKKATDTTFLASIVAKI